MIKNILTKEQTIEELTKLKDRVVNITDDRNEIRDLSKDMMNVLIQYWNSFKFAKLTHNAGLDDGILYKDYAKGKMTGLYFRWQDHIESLLKQISTIEDKINFLHPEPWGKLCEMFLKSRTLSGCYCCGAEYNLIPNIETNTIEMLGGTICPFKDGIDDAKADIQVQSGKLVFTNVFGEIIPYESRLVFEFAKEKYGYYQSVNSLIGTIMNFEFEASRGVAYIFTGNTCPSVFKNKNSGLISIKSSSEKQDDDECMGSICTDLWAAQAIDYELLKSLYKDFNSVDGEIVVSDVDKGFEEYLQKINSFVVDVEPGTYTINFNCKFPNKYSWENEPTYFGDLILKKGE